MCTYVLFAHCKGYSNRFETIILLSNKNQGGNLSFLSNGPVKVFKMVHVEIAILLSWDFIILSVYINVKYKLTIINYPFLPCIHREPLLTTCTNVAFKDTHVRMNHTNNTQQCNLHCNLSDAHRLIQRRPLLSLK